MKIQNIEALASTWDKLIVDKLADIQWEDLLKNYLFKAARRMRSKGC